MEDDDDKNGVDLKLISVRRWWWMWSEAKLESTQKKIMIQ